MYIYICIYIYIYIYKSYIKNIYIVIYGNLYEQLDEHLHGSPHGQQRLVCRRLSAARPGCWRWLVNVFVKVFVKDARRDVWTLFTERKPNIL